MSFVGRSVDLSIFDTTEDPGVQILPLVFVDAGEVTTGILKLAQIVLRFILTEKGTMPSDSTYGASFMSLLLSGQLHTETQLAAEFNNAATEAIDFIRLYETSSLPDDEKIGDIILEDYSVAYDRATIRFKVVSLAKEDREIIVPISIPLGK